ncbi:two-component hybrid sensor and regulator [Calothrix sp. NIES-4071]|nr:two-component hybrid sensor and regulator [Calothrix sp. NIES-4071]BAZ58027.1 two-component hybrid sensor and regulator [Calothrix sp. NIES-4105]
MKLPLIRRQINLGLGLTLLLVIFNAALSYRNTLKVVENERSLAHTHKVITELEKTLSTLKDAETGQRGYLLTGDDSYLKPYQAAINTVNQQIGGLQQLTSDNPKQQQRIVDLKKSVDAKLTELESTIDIQLTQGQQAALQVVRSNRGKLIMDEIRRQVASLQLEERKLLQLHDAESKVSIDNTLLSSVVANSVNILGIGIIYYLFHRDKILRHHEQTQQNQILQQLQAERNRLETIMRVLPVGVLICDADGKEILANTQAEEILGHKLPGTQNIDEYNQYKGKHPDGRPYEAREYPLIRSLLTGESIFNEELWYSRPDDSERILYLSSTSIRDSENHIIAAVVTFYDGTFLKTAEAQLRSSDEKFRQLAENIHEVFWIFDPHNTQLIYVSPAYERIWGRTVESLQNNPMGWSDAIHPDDKQRHAELHKENIHKGTLNIEYRIIRPNGEERWIQDRGFPVRNFEGEIYRIAGVAEDVTERKLKEAEIQLLNETLEQRVEERTLQLQEVNAEMEAFAYSISHDLRAPLRTMQGFAQALQEDYGDQLDEMAQEYIQYITEGALQMDSLIADLLAYSRLTRVEIKLQELDLNSVVTEALKQLGAQIKEKHALVTIDTLPSVMAHRPTLIQVITNLISNAIKFVHSETQPKVDIYAREQENSVYLWVEDNGIGIAPEHQERIFRVFERLHGAESYPGTGIGLAIVRKAIERMGGKVGVESQVNSGSRFWIELIKRL